MVGFRRGDGHPRIRAGRSPVVAPRPRGPGGGAGDRDPGRQDLGGEERSLWHPAGRSLGLPCASLARGTTRGRPPLRRIHQERHPTGRRHLRRGDGGRRRPDLPGADGAGGAAGGAGRGGQRGPAGAARDEREQEIRSTALRRLEEARPRNRNLAPRRGRRVDRAPAARGGSRGDRRRGGGAEAGGAAGLRSGPPALASGRAPGGRGILPPGGGPRPRERGTLALPPSPRGSGPGGTHGGPGGGAPLRGRGGDGGGWGSRGSGATRRR